MEVRLRIGELPFLCGSWWKVDVYSSGDKFPFTEGDLSREMGLDEDAFLYSPFWHRIEFTGGFKTKEAALRFADKVKQAVKNLTAK